jgi:hypothetical protein
VIWNFVGLGNSPSLQYYIVRTLISLITAKTQKRPYTNALPSLRLYLFKGFSLFLNIQGGGGHRKQGKHADLPLQ